jgi:hydroxymethylpyrimidine/phosphomethylpyrimidine kinase
LIVAGSDSGGGAGIQADIKTVSALGGYAMTAITALTAQNTLGVQGVFAIDPAFIRQQIEVVLDDLGADALKTGMLHNAAVIKTVAACLRERAAGLPVVVDPVMVAQSGASLLDAAAADTLKHELLPLADLLTPNVPEAEVLTGRRIENLEDMRVAAASLLRQGPKAVLVKGGHLSGEILTDLLATPEGSEVLSGPRIHTRHAHGTGCTLASAIATGLGQGLPLSAAVHRARAYLQEALRSAPGLGRGDGPVNHQHTVRPFTG